MPRQGRLLGTEEHSLFKLAPGLGKPTATERTEEKGAVQQGRGSRFQAPRFSTGCVKLPAMFTSATVAS